MDIEQKARQLWQSQYDAVGYSELSPMAPRRVFGVHEQFALQAIVAALTPPEGYMLVPVEPTETMLTAGRTAVMARDCSGPKWGAGDHYEAGGYPTDGIPPRLLEGKGKMSKSHCAELAYTAMLAARPEVP